MNLPGLAALEAVTFEVPEAGEAAVLQEGSGGEEEEVDVEVVEVVIVVEASPPTPPPVGGL